MLICDANHSDPGMRSPFILLPKSHYTSRCISGIIKELTCFFETKRGGDYLSSLLAQMIVAILAGIVVALFSSWLNHR